MAAFDEFLGVGGPTLKLKTWEKVFISKQTFGGTLIDNFQQIIDKSA